MRLVINNQHVDFVKAFAQLSLEDRLEYLTLEIEWKKKAATSTTEMYEVYGILEDWLKEKGLDETCLPEIRLVWGPHEDEAEHRDIENHEVVLVTLPD